MALTRENFKATFSLVAVAKQVRQGKVYWTQNICEPQLRHSKRGKEDGKGKGGSKMPCAISTPSSPYLG
jgi:hypothetical protein